MDSTNLTQQGRDSRLMYQEIRIKNREELLERKKRYLNTTGTSDRTGQRMDDVRMNYRLGKTVQMDAKTDSRNFCTDVRFQPKKYLKYESDIGDMLGHRGEFSYAESRSNPVVQRKLDGTNGQLLRSIAEFIPEGTCKNFILWLDKNDEKISIELNETMSSYDAKTKTLYFSGSMFSQILKAKENKDYESLSVFFSNICHELSHAHDFISGKEKLDGGDMSQETCISTELHAWEQEAISVLETNKVYGLAYNQSNTELIDGWVNLEIDMLDRLYQHKNNNCIIDRIIRYISRCVGSKSEIVIQGWMNVRREKYAEQITSLQGSFLKKKSELYG